jgi:hypothetical protein
LARVWRGDKLPPKLPVNIFPGYCDSEGRGSLAQNFGVYQILEVLEWDGAEVHLAALVSINTLEHADSRDKVSHVELNVAYRACPDPRRFVEFLIVTEGDHAHYDEQKGGADSNTYLALPPLGHDRWVYLR